MHSNPYSYENVKKMNGQLVAEACRDLGIKCGTRSNEDLKKLIVKEGKKMKDANKSNVNPVVNEATTPNKPNGNNLFEINVFDILKSIEAQLIELNELTKAQNSMLEDMYLHILDAPSTAPEEPKEPKKVVDRDITDEELERYIDGLNPLHLANTPVGNAYKDFVEWCKYRTLIPCTQTKLTRRICKIHPFTKGKDGLFTPIAK